MLGVCAQDFWTGHHAHDLGWLSAYLRKDCQGDEEVRTRRSNL